MKTKPNKKKETQPERMLLPCVAVITADQLRESERDEAPMDNAAVWLSQLEVECLYGIGRTKYYAMQKHDRRYFRGGKTTKQLLDAFQREYPTFTVREVYAS